MATLTQVAGPDVCCLKVEVFDEDFARWIVEAKDTDITKEERDAVRKILKNRTAGTNQHKTTYKLGKDIKHDDLGRFVAMKGEGLQCLSRRCRSALAQKFYWDVDIRNAQPTLLQQYAEKRGWVCSALKKYNENRDDLIAELQETLSLSRDDAKQRVSALCFGGSADGLTPFFVNDLRPELKKLMENVFTANEKEHPSIAKRGMRSLMALVLQTEERKCLLAMDCAFGRNGRSLEVYIHDGGLVRKKENEHHLPEDLLRKVEAEVLRETGYKISVAVKEMKTPLVMSGKDEATQDEEAYSSLKIRWEDTGYKGYTTFYLREQSCFVKVSENIKDSILMKCKNDLYNDEEANKLPSGELFIKAWLGDPTRREFYKMDFLPGKETPEHTYNMFHGFSTPAVQGDFTPFTEVLDLISGKNPKIAEYVEKWLACMIQRPYQKTGVCIIVKGKKGVGKDTFFDGVGRIIGDKHFLTTAKPEVEVFGKFNSQLSQLLFLKFEEANFETNRDNEDQLKKLITSEHESIERKGHDPIRTTSCVNSVMTTNKHIPIPMSDDERRFMMIEASDERKGDEVFWKRIHTALRDPAVLSAYHYHLLHLDITDFEPTQVIRTAYYHDVLQTFAPYHARYFQRMLEEDGIGREEPYIWSARQLFLSMKGLSTKQSDLSEQRFGRDLRVYDTIMTKRRVGWGNEYRVDPHTLKTFLEEKGWWIEY